MESSQKQTFWQTIALFHDVGVLEYIVVVGSWAEYLYQEAGLIPGFRSSFRTQDFDVLLRNIRLPNRAVDLAAEFKRNGYLMMQDPQTGLMKFDKGGELEVEFLVREMGKGQLEPYKHEYLGVTAQGLRYIDMLSEHSTVLQLRGYLIRVPRPQAYVLHKLLINKQRSAAKQEKDIGAVRELLASMSEFPAELLLLQELFDGLPKKAQAKIKDTCEKNVICWDKRSAD